MEYEYDEFPLITADVQQSSLSTLYSDSRHGNNPHSAAIRTNFIKIITHFPNIIMSCGNVADEVVGEVVEEKIMPRELHSLNLVQNS